ncbi:B12-binding domain-containing radical SAM protein [Enhygromyxa salina]|uniref:B12 binding domain protein n=1 Tax=Enhygromyxa salina TaxID=215803 RepID=A0A2S9YIR0_9BACT|nr:radical SAM protein [Enhygromyxa salina]PRQ04994.1 B12 binding domain protein [Enhygromyxa salina]
MKVLLLFFTDPRRAFSSSVAALSAVVREAGHEPIALEIFRKFRIDHVAAYIDELQPDVIGVSSMTRDWPGASALLLALARDRSDQPRPFVVVGGYHASLAPHDVAGCAAVDAVCIGEGERPLRALLDRVAAGERTLASTPGLWVRQGDGWTDPVPPADPVPDIASLPRWDYEVFGEVSQIIDDGINTFGPLADGFLPTRAGRGCPFTCAYCSAPRWGKLQDFAARDKRNARPVAHLCDELADLRDRYSPEGFEFWDEHFPLDLAWLRELAGEYPRRVGLPFKVEMHPSAASRERLALLAEAGCVLFHCGIEAGDEGFRRDVLNRRTPDAKLQQVFDDCRELGLETSASLMTMLPGETRTHTRSTTDLLHRLRPGSFMWSTYHPLPGTVLGDAAVERWPSPARETFDDYDEVQTLTPPLVDATERSETFLELGQLQTQLVQIAAKRIDDSDSALVGDGTPRRRARPIEIPMPKRPAPRGLAALLGLASPDAALERARAGLVSFEQGVLRVEIDHPSFVGSAAWEVRVAPLDGSRHFIEAGKVGLSYRGREAPTELLDTMRSMAVALRDVGIEQLRDALD